jgi:hypothetical protein
LSSIARNPSAVIAAKKFIARAICLAAPSPPFPIHHQFRCVVDRQAGFNGHACVGSITDRPQPRNKLAADSRQRFGILDDDEREPQGAEHRANQGVAKPPKGFRGEQLAAIPRLQTGGRVERLSSDAKLVGTGSQDDMQLVVVADDGNTALRDCSNYWPDCRRFRLAESWNGA